MNVSTHKKQIPIYNHLENYFAIIAIIPGFLSIMAYEFLAFIVHLIYPNDPYEPVNGLGILIPMAILMELFTFFFTKSLRKKINTLTGAIGKVAHGDFSVVLDEKKAVPFQDVYINFNQMAEDLQSVETLRTDFINHFSHEFKTPISSIGGFAKLLLDTEVSDAERNEYLQIIAEESDRLTHLAEQTMMMSKLDSQTEIKGKEHFTLDEQIRKVLILLQKDIEKKQIALEIHLEKLPCYGNPSMMEQVWINLFHNAVKFTPEYGTIQVLGTITEEPDIVSKKKAKKERNHPAIFKREETEPVIQVRITNSGPGMTEEQCRRIFQKYYQADTSHSGKGLGLGLSIVHRIMELSHGTIEVTSAPEKGTCFTLLFPSGDK